MLLQRMNLGFQEDILPFYEFFFAEAGPVTQEATFFPNIALANIDMPYERGIC